MCIASPFHCCVKGDCVAIVLPAAPLEHGGQIRATAEPSLCGDHEARVHVDRRHVRILRMGDERNAGGPEARVHFGPRNVFAEFRRELAKHGRHMHGDFLEHAPVHARHHAAAARLGVSGSCA